MKKKSSRQNTPRRKASITWESLWSLEAEGMNTPSIPEGPQKPYREPVKDTP